MATYLEHANMTVPDVDAAIAFLQTVSPAFKVRLEKTGDSSYRWAHVGSDFFYIALQEPHVGSEPEHPLPTYRNYGVNHLAWVVDDLASVVKRLERGGYRRGIPVARESYRKRAYYFDQAGFEWEIIEYLSSDPAQRNMSE